jgi:hypothetical protein
MSFAKWVFRIAGVYGLLVLLPMYFMERQIGIDQPPAITHAEYFYGFLGVAVAWQIAFLVISLDPQRYRLLMLPAIVEKFSFVAPAAVLMLQHRLPGPMVVAASLDFVLGVLFAIAFVRTMPTSKVDARAES